MEVQVGVANGSCVLVEVGVKVGVKVGEKVEVGEGVKVGMGVLVEVGENVGDWAQAAGTTTQEKKAKKIYFTTKTPRRQEMLFSFPKINPWRLGALVVELLEFFSTQ